MKPNVIFILSDDQSAFAQHRRCPEIITPNLDALAESGCDFENCFCASPVCSPARASILTGTMPSYHGIHDWIISGSVDPSALPDFSRNRPPIRDNETVAIDYLEGITAYTDILADNGYDIALSGKWHLGDTMKQRKGYTYWNTILRGGCRYTSYDMYYQGEVTAHTDYLTDRIADNAIDYLRHHRTEKPFYLGIHFTAPHTPWDREEHPAEIWDLYENADFQSIPWAPVHKNQMRNSFIGDTPEKRRELIRGYFTAVTAMDRAIGRVLDAVRELGLEEDTLVVFTGDNGMNVGQHGIWGKGNGTYPQNFYEESIRVPLILRMPGKRSRTVSDMVSHVDIFPTILALCGVDTASDRPCGSSFAGALDGEPFQREFVSVYSEYGAVRMLRDHRYKYVKNFVSGEDLFFDLETDPGEEANRIDDPAYAEIICRMDQVLAEGFHQYASSERDGQYQFPKGMGQTDICDRQNSQSAYRPAAPLYHAK